MAAKIAAVELAAPSIGSGPPRFAGETATRAAEPSVQSSDVSITGVAAQLASLVGTEQALYALQGAGG